MSSSQERDKAIEQSAGSRTFTRRIFVSKAVCFTVIPCAMYGAADLLLTGKRFFVDYPEAAKKLKEELDNIYGKSTYTNKVEAETRFNEIDSRAQRTAIQNDWEGVHEITSSPDFKQAYTEKLRSKALFDARYNAETANIAEASKDLFRLPSTLMVTFGLGGMHLWTRFIATPHYIAERARRINHATQMLYSKHPEWQDNAPSKDEIVNFFRSVSYLPPVGGKIPLIIDSEKEKTHDPLKPSWLAEEQVNQINGFRQAGELGQTYVHQLTVQGRLPDRFKLAALALILHSPHSNDWNNPMIKARWGSVAPLVHDGGIVETDLNPKWRKVRGRTDFLQRVVIVKEPTLENLESLSPEEKSLLSVDTLARARAEQEERGRLLLEAKAYQRIALALHAYSGSIPRHVPGEVRRQLYIEWLNFEAQMKSLLEEYAIEDAANVRWFLEKPREVDGWTGKRYEADWPPVQQELIHLEDVRREQPEIKDRIRAILEQSTENVDRIIGLKAA